MHQMIATAMELGVGIRLLAIWMVVHLPFFFATYVLCSS